MTSLQLAVLLTSAAGAAIFVASGLRKTFVFLPAIALIYFGFVTDADGFHPEALSVWVRIGALLTAPLLAYSWLEDNPTARDYFLFTGGASLLFVAWSAYKGVRLIPATAAYSEFATAVWYGLACLATIATSLSIRFHAATFYVASAVLALAYVATLVTFVEFGGPSHSLPGAGPNLAASSAHTAGLLIALGAFYIANLMKAGLVSQVDRKRIFKLFMALASASMIAKTPELQPLLSTLPLLKAAVPAVDSIGFAVLPVIVIARRRQMDSKHQLRGRFGKLD